MAIIIILNNVPSLVQHAARTVESITVSAVYLHRASIHAHACSVNLADLCFHLELQKQQ